MIGQARLPVALGAAALGLVLLAGIPAIPPGAGYDRVGPRVVPLMVAVGLVLIGGWLTVVRLTGGGAGLKADPHPQWNRRPLVFLGLAGVLFLVLVERAGFVVAAALQFWLVARGFHSRRPLRDMVAALLVSLAVYVSLTAGLGLSLPSGPF